MALRNIGGDKGDKFFRYKMPDIMSKVEKPGTNGQQTVILNIAEISKAIKINPQYTTKFFGYELGAQASYQASSDRTCAVLKGIHRIDELRKLLEKFISMFILCPTCKLPEITMSAKKSVTAICASCGFGGPLNTGHRLEKFIVNHPPSGGKDKSGKKKKKKRGKKGKDRDEEPSVEAAPSTSIPEIKASEEAPERKAPQGDTKTKWTADVSAEAQEARRQALMATETADSKRRAKVGKVDNSKPEQVLRAFTIEADRDVHQIVSELDRLRLSHDLSMQEKFRVVLEGLVDINKPKKLGKQFKKQAKVFKALAKGASEKTMLITSIVRFLQDGCLDRLPIVLQALHEKDVLDDQSVLSWAASPPEADSAAVGKTVAVEARKAAQVFVDWLEEDDEESDE